MTYPSLAVVSFPSLSPRRGNKPKPRRLFVSIRSINNIVGAHSCRGRRDPPPKGPQRERERDRAKEGGRLIPLKQPRTLYKLCRRPIKSPMQAARFPRRMKLGFNADWATHAVRHTSPFHILRGLCRKDRGSKFLCQDVVSGKSPTRAGAEQAGGVLRAHSVQMLVTKLLQSPSKLCV